MQKLKDQVNSTVPASRIAAMSAEEDDLSIVLAKLSVPWPEFVNALERFCVMQGWIIEYESLDDESCAIFFQPARQVHNE